WTDGLYLNGALVQSVLTDVNGVYRFSNMPPTDGTANRYELRFTAPGAGPNTAKLGKADSAFTNLLQRITNIAVPSGSNLQNLNLPIGPNGVVYNSMTRAPIAGATLKMLHGSAAPGSSQIYNNHIPLDPQLAGAFSITKTTPLVNVTRGQLVPYTVTISNAIGASLQGEQVVDRYPAGFRYVPGSARLDG